MVGCGRVCSVIMVSGPLCVVEGSLSILLLLPIWARNLVILLCLCGLVALMVLLLLGMVAGMADFFLLIFGVGGWIPLSLMSRIWDSVGGVWYSHAALWSILSSSGCAPCVLLYSVPSGLL